MNRHFEIKFLKKKRATEITDKNSGILSKHLDPTLDHFPIKTKANIRCGLYKWFGMKTEINIVYCPSFNFSLCISCYSGFHSVTDIVRDKNKLKLKYKT